MKTNTSVKNQSNATVREQYTTSFVTSKDGTAIGYRQLGHGPGVVLVVQRQRGGRPRGSPVPYPLWRVASMRIMIGKDGGYGTGDREGRPPR